MSTALTDDDDSGNSDSDDGMDTEADEEDRHVVKKRKMKGKQKEVGEKLPAHSSRVRASQMKKLNEKRVPLVQRQDKDVEMSDVPIGM